MSESPENTPDEQYVVVARRYRPQAFDELIGQQHVSQALTNAIATNRVGHAYLFTGARGVGKTSAARILAKALNCQEGPTATPCNQCDICQSIASGEDVDVLEIDGASNRGIDEIRQLRQNVNVRPSRSRLKIYIIDEVHMLTREAFNALLKTLEEPPEHVKFIFCTTEANKIPVTILSRCQRFDFAGILTASIAERLAQIVQAEGVEADTDALEVLARRATGSMRDSQSLLEQLLAFSPGRITLDEVHSMLGTADEERLTALVAHLADRDAAAALADLDQAVTEGVEVAQLLEQLFGYFRDCMMAAAGCSPETFLFASPTKADQVAAAGERLGLQTVLAVMQILDQTLSRLRFSTQGRILAELALVRVCQLEELDELPGWIAQLRSGEPISPPAVNRPSANPSNPVRQPPETAAPTTSREASPLTAENAAETWSRAVETLPGMAAENAKQFDRVQLAGENHLVIHFKAGYAFQKSCCERPDQVARFEKALAEITGQRVRIGFEVDEASGGADSAPKPQKPASPHQRVLQVMDNPMIRQAGELFGAEPTDVEDPQDKSE